MGVRDLAEVAKGFARRLDVLSPTVSDDEGHGARFELKGRVLLAYTKAALLRRINI